MSLSRLEHCVELLHASAEATLATQSQTLPGYPFASAVMCCPDAAHRPLLLLSRLAEHTRNLEADARASLLVARALGDGEIARGTLLGEIAPCAAEPLLVARFLRYHPPAARFLQLGDFGFWRMAPQKILAVGGFARAGWLEGERLASLAALPLAVEAACLEALAPLAPPGATLLGIDAYGIDLRGAAGRQRLRFPEAPQAETELCAAARGLLTARL